MPTPQGTTTTIFASSDLLELDPHGIHLGGKFLQADRNAGYGTKYCQSSLFSLACSYSSFMAAVNYYWPPEQRRAHNDLIGWQLSVLGTTYAVIIGFYALYRFGSTSERPT